MSVQLWRDVDSYIEGRLVREDEGLSAAIRESEAAGLPAIAVSAAQGKFLNLLALSVGARRILEIGTLGGYSAIWMARALPADGELVSLEIDPRNADLARKNMARANTAAQVVVRPDHQQLLDAVLVKKLQHRLARRALGHGDQALLGCHGDRYWLIKTILKAQVAAGDDADRAVALDHRHAGDAA